MPGRAAPLIASKKRTSASFTGQRIRTSTLQQAAGFLSGPGYKSWSGDGSYLTEAYCGGFQSLQADVGILQGLYMYSIQLAVKTQLIYCTVCTMYKNYMFRPILAIFRFFV